MLEETLAFARMETEKKAKMHLAMPERLKECIDEIAKEEETSPTNIICSTLKVLCEEWKMGTKPDIITRERANLLKMLFAKEDYLEKFLADNTHDQEFFEHRGYALLDNEDTHYYKEKIEMTITQIERLKKELNIEQEDTKTVYKGDL